jgi:uncharacterized protein involved in outer membrane biogenesis
MCVLGARGQWRNMAKKILIGTVLIIAVVSLGLFLWARAVLTPENARTALEAQLSSALGQPVSIGSLGLGFYPRITLLLRDVAVGAPPQMTAQRLNMGTDFRALLSRRIEHASVRLTGARIELPMAIVPVPVVQPGSSDAAADLPVEIVSIDEIVLSDVELVSAGRTLRADVELVPHGQGFTIRTATLRAEDMHASISGEIANLSGPVGELSLETGSLKLDALLAFAGQFAGGAGLGSGSAGASEGRARVPAAVPLSLTIAMKSEAAALGSLTLAGLTGTATVTEDGLTLEPIAFRSFGGQYGGALSLAVSDPVKFALTGDVSGIDMTEVMKYAGSPGTITGRLSGRLDFTGRGDAPSQALSSTSGTARIDIVDGIVRDLGLVRAIVIAGSGRSDQREAERGARNEPFTRIGATLKVASGVAHTSDLRLESKDLLLSAAGMIALDGTSLDLAGTVQLSEALAARAGRDLVRYTQVDGRPTMPVRISGSANAPRVSVDVGGVLRQAITNKAKEEIGNTIKRGLGGLIRR